MGEVKQTGAGLPDPASFGRIRRLSADIRIEMINRLALLGLGHIDGSVSIAYILEIPYYCCFMKIDPKNSQWEDRGWLALSIGYCGLTLCATRDMMPISCMQS
jgi:transketolase